MMKFSKFFLISFLVLFLCVNSQENTDVKDIPNVKNTLDESYLNMASRFASGTMIGLLGKIWEIRQGPYQLTNIKLKSFHMPTIQSSFLPKSISTTIKERTISFTANWSLNSFEKGNKKILKEGSLSVLAKNITINFETKMNSDSIFTAHSKVIHCRAEVGQLDLHLKGYPMLSYFSSYFNAGVKQVVKMNICLNLKKAYDTRINRVFSTTTLIARFWHSFYSELFSDQAPNSERVEDIREETLESDKKKVLVNPVSDMVSIFIPESSFSRVVEDAFQQGKLKEVVAVEEFEDDVEEIVVRELVMADEKYRSGKIFIKMSLLSAPSIHLHPNTSDVNMEVKLEILSRRLDNTEDKVAVWHLGLNATCHVEVRNNKVIVQLDEVVVVWAEEKFKIDNLNVFEEVIEDVIESFGNHANHQLEKGLLFPQLDNVELINVRVLMEEAGVTVKTDLKEMQ